jgi:hypothetical protein
MRWGLIPSWATDMSIGNRTLNARSEDEELQFASLLFSDIGIGGGGGSQGIDNA